MIASRPQLHEEMKELESILSLYKESFPNNPAFSGKKAKKAEEAKAGSGIEESLKKIADVVAMHTAAIRGGQTAEGASTDVVQAMAEIHSAFTGLTNPANDFNWNQAKDNFVNTCVQLVNRSHARVSTSGASFRDVEGFIYKYTQSDAGKQLQQKTFERAPEPEPVAAVEEEARPATPVKEQQPSPKKSSRKQRSEKKHEKAKAAAEPEVAAPVAEEPKQAEPVEEEKQPAEAPAAHAEEPEEEEDDDDFLKSPGDDGSVSKKQFVDKDGFVHHVSGSSKDSHYQSLRQYKSNRGGRGAGFQKRGGEGTRQGGRGRGDRPPRKEREGGEGAERGERRERRGGNGGRGKGDRPKTARGRGDVRVDDSKPTDAAAE